MANEQKFYKQNFTLEEWTNILESPMLAGIAVSAADPSGAWGLLKEAFASGSAIKKIDVSSNDLIKAVSVDFETVLQTDYIHVEGAHSERQLQRTVIQEQLDRRFAGAKPDDVVQRCLAHLGEVSRLLDERVPEDAVAFKAWLRDISQKVAVAAIEGGFLGFGGVRVSDAEKATLDDISKALA